MRILIGMPSEDSLGGPIYCEPLFVRSLREIGAEVDEEVYVYGEGLNPTSLWGRVTRVLDAAHRLRRRTRAKKYDIIHLNTSIDRKCVVRDLVTLAYLRSSGVPVHFKMHGSIASFLRTGNPFWRYLMKRLFALASDIGVLSSEERENFIAAGCPREKLSDARYVVDAGAFRIDPNFRTRHRLMSETTILLFSARFTPAKGLLDVITACGHLNENARDFVLFCLGDGPSRGEAEELTEKLGLREHIRFTGYIVETETAAFHANSDIFVFPTYHDEGFPLVILKSLAAGLPIITTRIRAAADYMTEPENCLWVSPRSPSELAEKIGQLLDDKALQTTMSANNRRLADQFTAKNVAGHYLEIYGALIDE